jgi:hypothetical protein
LSSIKKKTFLAKKSSEVALNFFSEVMAPLLVQLRVRPGAGELTSKFMSIEARRRQQLSAVGGAAEEEAEAVEESSGRLR